MLDAASSKSSVVTYSLEERNEKFEKIIMYYSNKKMDKKDNYEKRKNKAKNLTLLLAY